MKWIKKIFKKIAAFFTGGGKRDNDDIYPMW